jgi:hypothetical protein
VARLRRIMGRERRRRIESEMVRLGYLSMLSRNASHYLFSPNSANVAKMEGITFQLITRLPGYYSIIMQRFSTNDYTIVSFRDPTLALETLFNSQRARTRDSKYGAESLRSLALSRISIVQFTFT